METFPWRMRLALFEEGMKLSKTLEKDLARVERRVEILTREPGSAPMRKSRASRFFPNWVKKKRIRKRIKQATRETGHHAPLGDSEIGEGALAHFQRIACRDAGPNGDKRIRLHVFDLEDFSLG